MVELELSKSEKVKRLTQIMAQIKNTGNLIGVLFAYRDGGLIAENFDEKIDFDIFNQIRIN